jgi:hypothetical protein
VPAFLAIIREGVPFISIAVLCDNIFEISKKKYFFQYFLKRNKKKCQSR